MFGIEIDWKTIWDYYGFIAIILFFFIIIGIRKLIQKIKTKKVKKMDAYEEKLFRKRLEEIQKEVRNIRTDEMKEHELVTQKYTQQDKNLREEYDYICQRIQSGK